jgi:hypothetical protein
MNTPHQVHIEREARVKDRFKGYIHSRVPGSIYLAGKLQTRHNSHASKKKRHQKAGLDRIEVKVIKLVNQSIVWCLSCGNT